MTRSTARGSRSGPSPRTTTAASTSGPRAARPQRSDTPGPRSQPGQWMVGASTSTSCAPRTTRISSTLLSRSRSSTGPRRTRCFGEPNRVEAPAPRTTAAIMPQRLRAHGDLAHLDPPRRLLVLRIAEPSDAEDDRQAARDLAEERVLRREARVRAGDNEELTAGGACRLGAGLRHRDNAARVARVRGRRVDDGVAGTPRPVPVRVAALDHEARNDSVEDEPVVEVPA